MGRKGRKRHSGKKAGTDRDGHWEGRGSLGHSESLGRVGAGGGEGGGRPGLAGWQAEPLRGEAGRRG